MLVSWSLVASTKKMREVFSAVIESLPDQIRDRPFTIDQRQIHVFIAVFKMVRSSK
jgi:hypothetical protein